MGFHIKENQLHYYLDLVRDKSNCVRSLHNVIRTMEVSRHSYICGEDFSRLDFGNIPSNNIYFSDNGKGSSIFDGSTFNEWNFINGHSGEINCVAYSPDGKTCITVSVDRLDSTAIIWDMETLTQTHLPQFLQKHLPFISRQEIPGQAINMVGIIYVYFNNS